ncbi:MAG: 4Fe-4S binding protein [Elusimicrobiota bacterium]
MARRKIIKIDSKKCDGCGLCARGCPEGAIQIIEGKARLVSEVLCDGLGACIGECPRGAIKIQYGEAAPYDEIKTLKNVIKQGAGTIIAHLRHLKEHGQEQYYRQAMAYLKEKKINIPQMGQNSSLSGCPGSATMSLAPSSGSGRRAAFSCLAQWPVQGHLISPLAPYFRSADLLVAADCCAFSYGNFHEDFMKGKAIFIACPKLDSNLESYQEKFLALIDGAEVKSIEVVTMEVPCCSGLLRLLENALSMSRRKPPLKHTVIGINGEIKNRI